MTMKKFLRIIIAIIISPLWLYYVVIDTAIVIPLFRFYYWVTETEPCNNAYSRTKSKDIWLSLYRWVRL